MRKHRTESVAGEGLVRDIARAAVKRAAPEELVVFDETADDFFADPDGTLRAGSTDEPVGFGIDLALLTPYTLAVSGAVTNFLWTSLRNAAATESEAVIAARIRRLFHLGDRQETARQEAQQLTISPDIALRAHEIAHDAARAAGLTDDLADLLADAVAGGLLVRP